MELQKIPDSQNNPEQKEITWRDHIQSLKYFTEPQQYGICTKTDIQTKEQNRRLKHEHTDFSHLILNKDTKNTLGKRKHFNKGFWGSRCPSAELNQTHSYHFTQKLAKCET